MQMRRDRLRKLLKAQGKLREISELRLKRLRDKEMRLKQEQAETIEALNGDGPLHGLFVEPMARRLQDLSGRLSAVTNAIAKELSVIIAESAKVKHLRRLTANAELEHDRLQERKELLGIAEISLRKSNASLP
jgi:hypothetical protein